MRMRGDQSPELVLMTHLSSSDHSPADVDAQVSTDAAGLGVSRVGLTQHHPDQLHNVLPLPHLRHTHE